MKPKFKPPGTKRSQLNWDILLSTSAFKSNLRRYSLARLEELYQSVAELGSALAVGPGMMLLATSSARIVKPRLLRRMAFCDVASNIWQALGVGGGRAGRGTAAGAGGRAAPGRGGVQSKQSTDVQSPSPPPLCVRMSFRHEDKSCRHVRSDSSAYPKP